MEISRRTFLSATGVAAAGAAAGGLAAQGTRYDLLIKGGRVIDPASKLDAVRDVAIAGGRIVAVRANITADAATVIDARNRLVVPGLIDIHTHAARSTDLPLLLLKDGVTAWIDGGSQGADHIADPIAVARTSPQFGRVLVNIGRGGILTEGETKDLAQADVAAARDAIAKNREFVVGVKARLSSDVAGANDYEVLKRAQEAATPSGVPVMIHMRQTESPLTRLLPLLKKGDIVTHMYAPGPHGIIDERGKLLPVVLDARKRGVWFDVGNGRIGNIRWDIVEAATKQGFLPDAISTDWNATSPTSGVVNLPNCLSKFLNYGMSLSQVIACATVNSAKMFPAFKDRGTLAVGARADITLLELREGSFEFLDNFEGTVSGRQRMFPSETILGGVKVA